MSREGKLGLSLGVVASLTFYAKMAYHVNLGYQISFRYLIPTLFLGFVCWLIRQADTESSNAIFDIVGVMPFSDKIGHIFVFGGLSLLLNIVFKFKSLRFLGCKLQIGALIVLGFSSLEEITQTYVLARSVDLWDMYFNCFGILLFTEVSLRVMKALDASGIKESRSYIY